MSKKTAKRSHEKPSHAGTTLQPAHHYADAVGRVILQALSEIQELLEGVVGHRRLVNYLRGNQASPVNRQDEGPTSRSVYGIFWSEKASWAKEIIERLIEEGYLEVSPPPRRGLFLTDGGERLLRGRETAGGWLLPRRAALGTHPKLEERLRAMRQRVASKEGRPPFSIFSNATLAHLACDRPRNLGELAAVPGLGAQRIRKYGKKILGVLRKASGGREYRTRSVEVRSSSTLGVRWVAWLSAALLRLGACLRYTISLIVTGSRRGG